LLSLGPQHSFPLADVFRYLHPATARDVLVQAFLDAPVFQTRWRWNTTISLAVPRSRNGRKVPAPLQRMLADDLMAAVFPDAAACLENIPGDREIPDHPLVQQAVHDCLQDAMDFEGLARVLARIHAGGLQLVSRDTPEPSVLAHEILNARPYAFLDDAPLEERRAHAVYARRASEPSAAGALGALDADAIGRVRDEEALDVRDADELHDALLTRSFLTDAELDSVRPLLAPLLSARRATAVEMAGGGPANRLWVAAERLPEIRALHPDAAISPEVTVPATRADRAWSREEAILEIVRNRIAVLGPVTSGQLASPMGATEHEIDAALHALEGEGLVLRGAFTPASPRSDRERRALEWCDRRLLARIHRYTLNRLRAEIEPVSPADFMRFLFAWHHVDSGARLKGVDGLRAAIEILDGFELPAGAWERSVLPARVEDYDPSMLDMLCLTGQVGWARLGGGPAQLAGATPVALFLRQHHDAWRALSASGDDSLAAVPSDRARRILGLLQSRGASFLHELQQAAGADADDVRQALAELVAAGRAVSDGFAGLRSLIEPAARSRRIRSPIDLAGRWSASDATPDRSAIDAASERKAWSLLRRYGVVSRRLLTREANAPPWRMLLRVYRSLELRGDIRGGRFVTGMSGEQFALPEAVTRLREVRREAGSRRLVVIGAADPLNLAGIVTAGERVRVASSSRIAFRDGVPLAAMEGDYIRPLAPVDPSDAAEVASALAGRPVPAVIAGFVGRVG
jgi:ATP-dependent Lhr-like helicase